MRWCHHYRRGCEVVACKRGQCFIGEWALDGRGVENGGGACAGDADQVHTRRNRVQIGRAGATRDQDKSGRTCGG